MFVEPDQQLIDRLALALVPGLGPRLTAAILKQFGSAGAARRAPAGMLQEVPQIGSKLSANFAAALRDADIEGELQLLRKHNVGIVPVESPEYPAALAELPDPPQILFLKGSVIPADRRAIAIVGSRECTAYGRRVAERLATSLARAGCTIISGLARGIDGVAHEAALKAGGRTIAVLAGGLGRIYPPEHDDLAARVAESGALITETPMRMAPQAGMFPARNRLISGLSLGVIVVEAHERSGALITARHAAEQNRDVFAVPGPVDSIASAGCLQLLRNGAKMIRNADDVLEDIGGISATPQTAQVMRETEQPRAELAPAEEAIWKLLGGGACHVDQIARELNTPIPELMRLLMQLEMKRVIRRMPGNQYERR